MKLSALVCAVLIAMNGAASAQTWQTSFTCGKEWDQSQGISEAAVCDAGDLMTGWGNWTVSDGPPDSITVAANNPLGPGMAFRHWRGPGSGNNGGGIRIDFPSRPTEIWFRWYMRFQQGFAWDWINYTKDLYFNTANGSSTIFTAAFNGPNSFGIGMVAPNQLRHTSSPGWNAINGGTVGANGYAVGDGKYHHYEIHVDTVRGVFESWVDGVRTQSRTGLTLGGAPLAFVLVGSNQAYVAQQPNMYTDFDDIAWSSSGYIGPIGGTPPPSPALALDRPGVEGVQAPAMQPEQPSCLCWRL